MFEGEWDWIWLSTVVPLSDIRKYPNLPWSKSGLSHNPTLTVSDIQSLSEIKGEWDWDAISGKIPIIDVYTYSNLMWNRDGLSRNKDIRVSDLIAWHEILPSIYKRWQYPTDVVIV